MEIINQIELACRCECVRDWEIFSEHKKVRQFIYDVKVFRDDRFPDCEVHFKFKITKSYESSARIIRSWFDLNLPDIHVLLESLNFKIWFNCTKRK